MRPDNGSADGVLGVAPPDHKHMALLVETGLPARCLDLNALDSTLCCKGRKSEQKGGERQQQLAGYMSHQAS